MADEPAPLEDRMDRIERKLDELLGGSKQPEQAPAEDKPEGRPSTVEEQVRMELDRRDAEARAKQEKDDEESERQTIKDQLAKLTEAKPVQPQPRRQRIMWGPR